MYALLAFVSALSADLFVRALELGPRAPRSSPRSPAVLLPRSTRTARSSSPAEAVVALAVWRGRPLRPALPCLRCRAAARPIRRRDLRLADRFTVGVAGEESLAGPADAWSQLARALQSFAGGGGWTFGLFLALGIVGTVILLRTHTAFAAFGLLTLIAPPLLFMLLRTGSVMGLSPRHLVFALPLWAAAIGVAVATIARGFHPAVAVGVAAIVGRRTALAAGRRARPPGVAECRPRRRAGRDRDRQPRPARASGDYLRATVADGDLLFPFSSVFLAGLPATGQATSLPYSQTSLLESAVARMPERTGALVVAVPRRRGRGRSRAARGDLGQGFDAQLFPGWLLVRAEGPFPEATAALRANARVLTAALEAVEVGRYPVLRFYVERGLRSTCQTLASLGEACLT